MQPDEEKQDAESEELVARCVFNIKVRIIRL
jgi:hypothetical protein